MGTARGPHSLRALCRSLERTICSIEQHLFQPLLAEGYEVHAFIISEAHEPTTFKVWSGCGSEAACAVS